VAVVIDDRHARRDHDLAADAHVVPHVEGSPAVHGDVIANRQPGAVGDGDAHGQGIAEHSEPVTKDSFAPNMKLYFPPDIRKPTELCRGELGFYVPAPRLREKLRDIVKSQVHPHGVSHSHHRQVVMSGRHDPAGVSGADVSRSSNDGTSR
jgi:hypothetical protein